MALDNVNKYRTILSTYRNYLFDYNSYTDMFTIYLYRGNQCNAPIKGTLEQFRERMLRILRSDSERKEFATFYNYLKNGSNMFSCMVYLPLDEHNDELYKFKVNGDSLFSINKTSVVAGYLETVDGCVSDVIPYYATSEAVDSATGLLNKRACMEYTKSVIASKDDKIHYMIMFDVDNFKSINDTYGHLFGDEVLSKIAGIINANLNGRGIAGRFGGDEFYIFTNNIPRNEEDKSKYIKDVTVGKAVRASSSFPAVFMPCKIDEYAFMDGGVLDNVPVEEVRKQGVDKVLAVKFDADKIEKDSNLMDIAMKTIDIMGNKISEESLKKSDYVLNVYTDKVGLLDIKKLDKCYEYGYQSVMKNINEIKKALQ